MGAMTPLQRQILEKVVQPALRDFMTSVEGTIIAINAQDMVANVSYANLHGPGEKILNNVPIHVSSGLSVAGPFVGDRVIVSFQNGKIFSPVITSVIDRDHNKMTLNQQQRHNIKGAYVPDGICFRTDWGYTNDTIY